MIPFQISEAEPAAATLVLLVEDSVNNCFSIPAPAMMFKQQQHLWMGSPTANN